MTGRGEPSPVSCSVAAEELKGRGEPSPASCSLAVAVELGGIGEEKGLGTRRVEGMEALGEVRSPRRQSG
ncbi:hypothetical protein E2562_019610 [Oryza meyeriana var. granulata]|uniref:DUF834 domain-containing protein n=1 Tax=Oryza meyeriana var. granulata TaxID=110450 RepID=A0A6G1C7E6_9ORYZ|nr:hypothetical protein E2562_019610 [Oryza meyeriana var. granulata]